MQVNPIKSVCVIWLLCLQLAIGQQQTDTRISWIQQLRQLRLELRNCLQSADGVWPCFRGRSLKMFYGIMESDVIPLYAGVQLVAANISSVHQQKINDEHLKHLTWFDQLALSLAKGLTTHTLHVNFAEATDRYMSSRNENVSIPVHNSVGSARMRRHRYNMIMTMMFGVTALGAVLVPLGFQMLSIVSGKALLLAKMALLLASINGLKRVASSGLHYGLYHVPNEHLGGYYDRGDSNQHARHVPLPLAVAPSIEGIMK